VFRDKAAALRYPKFALGSMATVLLLVIMGMMRMKEMILSGSAYVFIRNATN
jgi:hypothetical protein